MSINYGATSTTVYGTNNANPGYPSGIAAGDLLVMTIGAREPGSTYVGTPLGWIGIGEMAGTFGTTAVDAGPTRMWMFVKIATGSETGTFNVAVANGAAMWVTMSRFRSTTGKFNLDWARGEDSSSGTGYSAACVPNSPRLTNGWIQPGDVLYAATTKPTDAGTYSAAAITVAGLTMASTTALASFATTNGNDMGGASAYAVVASGSQTSPNVTLSATMSVASYGPALVLRIRDNVPANPNPYMPYAVGSGFGRSDGGTTVNVGKPVEAENGDLILVALARGGTLSPILGAAPGKGWTVLSDQVVNTRSYAMFARIYNSADALTDWQLTQTTGATVSVAVTAIRNHSVVNVATDIQKGTGSNRGGSSVSTTTALGITTPADNALAIAMFGESTNAIGRWSQTTGDFILLTEQQDQGTVNVLIEYITLLQKEIATAGATGNVVLDYNPAAAANGWGQQFSIPGLLPPVVNLPTWRGANPIMSIFKGVTALATLYKGTWDVPGLNVPGLLGVTGGSRSGSNNFLLDTLTPGGFKHVVFLGIAGSASRDLTSIPAGWELYISGKNVNDATWNQWWILGSTSSTPSLSNFTISGSIESGTMVAITFADDFEVLGHAWTDSNSENNVSFPSPAVADALKDALVMRLVMFNHINTTDVTYMGTLDDQFSDLDATDSTERYQINLGFNEQAAGPIPASSDWWLNNGNPYKPIAHTMAFTKP